MAIIRFLKRIHPKITWFKLINGQGLKMIWKMIKFSWRWRNYKTNQ